MNAPVPKFMDGFEFGPFQVSLRSGLGGFGGVGRSGFYNRRLEEVVVVK